MSWKELQTLVILLSMKNAYPNPSGTLHEILALLKFKNQCPTFATGQNKLMNINLTRLKISISFWPYKTQFFCLAETQEQFSASWRQLLLSLQVPYLGFLRATSAAEEGLEAFPGIDAKWQGAAWACAPTATRDGSWALPAVTSHLWWLRRAAAGMGCLFFFLGKESNRGRKDRHALAGTLAFLSLGAATSLIPSLHRDRMGKGDSGLVLCMSLRSVVLMPCEGWPRIETRWS